MMAIEILDDETFLGSENSFNLFTVQKDSGSTTEDERATLQDIGKYHLGESVNVFRYGMFILWCICVFHLHCHSVFVLWKLSESGAITTFPLCTMKEYIASWQLTLK